MFKSIKVQETEPQSSWSVHQFRNFGESVYAALRDECEISIQEIDASTNEFHLRKIHKREVRAIMAKVRKMADKAQMSDVITVTELPDSAA